MAGYTRHESDGRMAFAGLRAGLEWYDVSFTSAVSNFTAAATAAITVDCQLVDREGFNIPKSIICEVIALLDENPLTTQSAHSAFTTSMTVSGNGFLIKATTVASRLLAMTNTSGLLSVVGTQSAATTRRFGLIFPDGRLIISPTLTWT